MRARLQGGGNQAYGKGGDEEHGATLETRIRVTVDPECAAGIGSGCQLLSLGRDVLEFSDTVLQRYAFFLEIRHVANKERMREGGIITAGAVDILVSTGIRCDSNFLSPCRRSSRAWA